MSCFCSTIDICVLLFFTIFYIYSFVFYCTSCVCQLLLKTLLSDWLIDWRPAVCYGHAQRSNETVMASVFLRKLLFRRNKSMKYCDQRLSVCLSGSISHKQHVQIYQIFCTCYLWQLLSPLTTMQCLFPVLWTSSCFPIMERIGQNQWLLVCFVQFGGGTEAKSVIVDCIWIKLKNFSCLRCSQKCRYLFESVHIVQSTHNRKYRNTSCVSKQLLKLVNFLLCFRAEAYACYHL